jgi:citrate lyase subunit beta/citryl-CoA lyase
MHSDRASAEEAQMMQPRSWLFVPADSERKIAKALESHADALIFDLEDTVVPAQKAAARAILKNLPKRSGGPVWWVRVNPLASEHHKDDLEVLGIADIHGIVLPKAEGGTDVIELSHRTGTIPIHAIVTETPGSLFNLMSYQTPGSPLVAMSWGAEDLSAALGASSKYDESGELAFTYKLARSLCLAGAVAAGVQAVDGVVADFRDEARLKREAEAARREGFTGKLAIHPDQVSVINAAFTPSAEDVRQAEEIVAAFEARPNAGVLSVGGKMVDRPHLVQARRVLERSVRRDEG